jgi:putative ATP-binding cassette transporter
MNQIDRHLWQRFWTIAKPYWFSQEKWGARSLLLVLVLLSLAVNGMNVFISFVARDFMTALSTKEAEKFFHICFAYAGVLLVGTPIVVFYDYLTDKLGLYWRRWLTHHFLEQYFTNRAFYQINFHPTIDNPDERISQDVNTFTTNALSYLLTLVNSIITLISFIGILWSISTSLAIVNILYCSCGTIMTIWFGKRLIALNFHQLKRNTRE